MAKAAHARHGGDTRRERTTTTDAPFEAPMGEWHALPTILALACCLAFAGLLVLVLRGGRAALPVDEAALSLVLAVRSPLLTSIMTDVTAIIMPSVLAAVSLALCVLGHSPRFLVSALVDAGGAVSLNWLIKHLVERPRPPEELRLAVESSSSFPSSHAVTAMAFYGLLIWLTLHYQRPCAWRRTLVVLLALAIVLVGISRIYLAVHYLTDVLAGYCVGAVWLAAYTRFVMPRVLDPGYRELRSIP